MHDTLSPHGASTTGLEIAIIGMAGRFPGAPDVATFWKNLVQGKESIRQLTREELLAQRVPAETIDLPDFVPAGAPLDQSDRFDASFFGYSPREAEILDPQQRLFLECAWHALETAGYAQEQFAGAIGVYAAAGMNSYLFNLHGNIDIRASVSPYELFIANDKDFLATRTAYKLNLRGPAMTVQTACSSSLVAVHLAVQSLIAGECDMALAGGVALSRQQGYRAQEGSILSPDGHCRAFDAKAAGTVGGNGVGIVVLKRLEDAIADGDHIDAVIKGSAVNNDGSLKASFTAPQVDSQAEVIAAAHAAAGVNADSIGYVEAHGTGTALGDPIEIAALTQAFRRDTTRTGFCAIGSVKTNIGHLDTAAGIAGLIKAALMLRHRRLPPSLHFTVPNPKIDFASSPFAVNAVLQHWTATGNARRAGVSSFGIGGTNAHVVLEEAPRSGPSSAASGPQLLLVSARSEAALRRSRDMLAAHLDVPGVPPLADVAYTLRDGRRTFAHRHAVLVSTAAEAARELRLPGKSGTNTTDAPISPVLLFPGQGSQYPGMAKTLHAGLPAFRAIFDTCCDKLTALLGRDIRDLIFSGSEEIHETAIAQPALFAVEYALGRLWLDTGLQPRALHGHSIGEYVAATLSGVFDLDTALSLVVERGRLMNAAAAGAMLAVIHPDREIGSWINGDLAIAANNAPGLSVVSGPGAAIADLQERLKVEGVASRRLQTSHAFHSPMMTNAAKAFEAVVARARLSAPRLPMISNVTGTWLTAEQATDPAYWSRHLLGTVRFEQGTATLLSLPRPLFIEAGPGQTLGLLTRQQLPQQADVLAGITDRGDETAQFLDSVGRVWASGIDLTWGSVFENHRRVPLPVYPFERQRYWIDADSAASVPVPLKATSASRNTDLENWFYRPSWRRSPLATDRVLSGKRWLVFDDGMLGSRLSAEIERSGGEAYRVVSGDAFGEPDFRCFSLNPSAAADHRVLMAALAERGAEPDHILFLWPLIASGKAPVQTLQNLIDALARNPRPVRLTVLTRGAADVTGVETIDAHQSVLHGLMQVTGQEYPWLGCRCIDLDPDMNFPAPALAERLRPELSATGDILSAWRGSNRWVLDFTNHALPAASAMKRLRRNGVFVVIGHIADGMGRIWAANLAKLPGVRLALFQDISAGDITAPAGIETITRRIDCSGPQNIKDAINEIAGKWGRIDGVFFSNPMSNHAATAPLALMGDGHWAYNQSVRTAPLQALAEAMLGQRIGFCCTQSSLSSVIGGVGLASYAGSHSFIDSFGAAQTRDGSTAWFSINWDALNDETGSAQSGRHAGANDFALSPDDAWECTCRIIEGGLQGQTVVSRGDLSARRAEWLSSEPRTESDTATSHRHNRPDLATPYIAPRNEVEKVVAGILQELLGIDRIGVDDGFFELGGHSLLAIRAIARLREAFPVDVEMRELLFENPTTAGIAQAISGKLPDQSELDAMAALLSQIDDLSDDDVNNQLPRASAQ